MAGRPRIRNRNLVKTKRLSVRITGRLHAEIDRLAISRRVSISDQTLTLIEQSLRDDRVLDAIKALSRVVTGKGTAP